MSVVIGGLLAILATSCSDPISPIDDFEFEFGEIDDVDLDEEPDTSIVEVEYTPVEEDTAYVERQSSFLQDAQASQQSGTVSEAVSDAAESADAAFDDSTKAELDSLSEQAEEDTDEFVENIEQALDDPDSPTAQFVAQVENLAAQQESLAALLGLGTASSAVGLVSGRANPPTIFVPFDSFDILDCRDDARAQYDARLARLAESRDAQEAAVERAYQRNLVVADTFRVQQLRRLDSERLERKRRARNFFADVRATITTLLADGTITDSTARQLRLVNMTVLLTRLKRSRDLYDRSVEAVHAAADSAIRLAADKRTAERQKIESSFDEAVKKLEDILKKALGACHDQGSSSS